jgi:glyoxalase family protein
VILSVPALDEISTIFKEFMNFEMVSQAQWIDRESKATIYTTKNGAGADSEVWLLEKPELEHASLGAGGTHHVTFRVPDFDTQEDWYSHFSEAGLRVGGSIDRFRFRSIYFRVSAGILFEIATDGPGFAIDEAQEALGETLVLPPFLENRRQEIETRLTPIGA